jgi:hypothetical protein
MTKRAFVIGANSTKLDYAESDAEKISQALSNLGYEIDGLTSATEERSDSLVQRFKEFVTKKPNADILIFYFAGHGLSDKKQLNLFLDTTNNDNLLSTSILFSEITGILENSLCTAKNKLIILDCCQANSDKFDITNADNYQLFRATEKWEDASEDKKLESGVFSYCIRKVLTESVDFRLLNKSHQLTINGLENATREQLAIYRSQNKTVEIPDFKISGNKANDFVIGQSTPQYAGLLAITPQFIEQERNKHLSDDSYSYEKFYGAIKDVQFWGIINGLVAERAIYPKIKNHIHEALNQKDIDPPIITLILGSGGMGKSTFLRQLAVDLASDSDVTKNYKVFWLEKWADFEAEKVADSLVQDSGYQLICLDDWRGLAGGDKESIKQWFRKHDNLHSKIKWLITNRKKAKGLREFIYAESSVFNFDNGIEIEDKAIDNRNLLTIVAEKMADWKDMALEFQNHAIANAKPFQILFVLHRRAGGKKIVKIENFETTFHEIIEYDIECLRNDTQIAGFANALIDFAHIFIKYKVKLTQNTFLRLANYHNHCSEKIDLFYAYEKTTLDNKKWGVLRYYLACFVQAVGETGQQESILEFTKDDLADAIIQNSNFRNEFEVRDKEVFKFILEDNSYYSASTMLRHLENSNVFDAREKLDFVKLLIENKNSHPDYAELLTKKETVLEFNDANERHHLIRKFIKLNPAKRIIYSYLNSLTKEDFQSSVVDNLVVTLLNLLDDTKIIRHRALSLLKMAQKQELICKCFDILGKTKETQQKATELLAQNQDKEVICKCFDILGKTKETQQKATELFAVENQAYHVVCKCFDILGKTDETRKKATELLAQENQTHEVICKCFDILGKTDETRKKATALLAQENQTHDVICKCFDILGKTDETRKKATALLTQENQSSDIICKCLDILGQTDETRKKATALLTQENQSSDIICKCLDILGQTELTKKYARQFMLDYANSENVLARCVNILEEEVKSFALEHLENWKELNSKLYLLQNCIYVCRNEKEIEEIVAAIIKQKNTSMHQYISVLKTPLSHIPIWQQETIAILNNWKTYKRAFVGASLIGNHNDLSKVKQTCQQILSSWEREISYNKERGYKVYHFHIFKALSYPSAEDPPYRRLVDMTAKAMLEKEEQQPDFLGDMLYEAAYNIVHHQQYPAWIPEEEI